MFRATFIGHQGWLLEAESTRLLVDPVLEEGFGNTPGTTLLAYPPREIRLERFPPLSAVLLTHEHEDHLHVPSLDRLSRDIPIYLSANSSSAASTLLEEMGFKVRRVRPGQQLSIGALNLLALGPAHDRNDNGDEWDVLPFLVWDISGHGNFFSFVDISPTDEMYQRARAYVSKLGVFALAWNNLHRGWRFLEAKPADPFELARMLAQSVLDLQRKLARVWSPPAAFSVIGSGFSLQGDLAWLNSNAFAADIDQVIESLRQLGMPPLLLAPLPGQAMVMERGKPCRVEEARDFLKAAPRERWPSRAFRGDQQTIPSDYGPAVGRREAGEAERQVLEEHLVQLARSLYGTKVFQELLSLHDDELRGRRRSIALVLKRAEGAAWVFEYDVRQCRFTQVNEEQPFSAYPAGIECWATDLLALFEGRLSIVSSLALGRARVWTALPGRLQGLFGLILVRFFHPLHRPDLALSLYRRLWAAVQESRAPETRIAVQSS